MRMIMLFVALTAALSAATWQTTRVIPVKQKVVRQRAQGGLSAKAPKNRKNKVKGRKAPKPRRQTR